MSEYGFLKKDKSIRHVRRKLFLLSLFLIAYFAIVNYTLKTEIIDVVSRTLDNAAESNVIKNKRLSFLKSRKEVLISQYNDEFKETNRLYADMKNLNNIMVDDFFRFARVLSIFITSDFGLTSVLFNRRSMEIKGASEMRKSITLFSENIKNSGNGYSAVIKDERIDPKGFIFFSMDIKRNE